MVFGPLFDTASKREYGEPLGVTKLAQVASRLSPFPVLALGGLEIDNVADCFQAGARGIAAIRMFSDPEQLADIVKNIRKRFERGKSSSSSEYKL